MSDFLVKMSNPNDDKNLIASKFLAREFPQQSPLISRLQHFIPQISAANEQLRQEGSTKNNGISIESVAKESGNDETSSSDEVKFLKFFI